MLNLRRAIFEPVVLIHCWGGLGSQFHAWHLLELLKLRNPRRNFGLVFHTAGVTKRFPEIEEFLSVHEIRRIDDFDAKNPNGKGLMSYNSTVVKNAKALTKHFLSLIGVENNHESLKSMIRIYPWTRIVRGHYSRIAIDDVALKRISSKIFTLSENHSKKDCGKLVVHLRLGDLRDLTDKSPIKEDSLRQVLGDLLASTVLEQTVVHSDSPDLVNAFLGSFSSNSLVIRDLAVTPLSALKEMVEADYFVGTSSKLSLWASIFRIKLGKENTYIPTHLSPALIDLLGKEFQSIHFYD